MLDRTVTRPSGTRAGHRSADAYLQTIYFLSAPVGAYAPVIKASPMRATHVATALDISRAAAGEMLGRLEREALIARSEDREIVLTRKGRARAELVVRRQRVIECLLTDFLDYRPEESHELANPLVGRVTDDMALQIHRRLGRPERCPHGWPVDPSVESSECAAVRPLWGTAAGTTARVVCLAEDDSQLLRHLYVRGLVPTTEITVDGVGLTADRLILRLNGRACTLEERAAAAVFVKPVETALRQS